MKASTKKLIDQYAELSLARAAVEKQLKELRPELLALGLGDFTGREHAVCISQTTRVELSVPLAKGFLTPAQIIAASLESDVTTVRVTQ